MQLDKPSLAIWAILRPRHAVTISDVPDDPGLYQNCVCVDYCVAGELADEYALTRGLWILESSEHALGRLFQREPNCDAAATVHSAHRALLATHTREFVMYDGARHQ